MGIEQALELLRSLMLPLPRSLLCRGGTPVEEGGQQYVLAATPLSGLQELRLSLSGGQARLGHAGEAPAASAHASRPANASLTPALPPSSTGRLRSLALGLPELADLQLNNCGELAGLALRCPRLARLSMQVRGGTGWGVSAGWVFLVVQQARCHLQSLHVRQLTPTLLKCVPVCPPAGLQVGQGGRAGGAGVGVPHAAGAGPAVLPGACAVLGCAGLEGRWLVRRHWLP